ncbi:P-loop containing nucleoside triphosphate hydrolase protein [Umbelopsis sp. PMI_123]|nr:P-loop containing nucleoside triphosphate hydrolase protein [Umbelopsis sp. PMI_123]
MDLFRLLGGGAKFDKKRFKDDFKLLDPSSTDQDLEETLIEQPDNTEERQKSLLNEIDFFKNTHTIVGNNKKKTETKNSKAKKIRKEVGKEDDEQQHISEDDEDEEENIFKNQEEVAQFRKQNRIRVYGDDIPNPFRKFADLSTPYYNIRSYIRRNLNENGFEEPTPIQMQSIPIIMRGRDIMSCAPTGSGKTLAYLLPIIHDLNGPEKVGYRALIVAPTRELAQQIFREIKRISAGKKFKICMLTKATAATQAQDPKLRQKFDILISTPLRLVHAIQSDEIELNRVQHLVLDEADKLLELGFLEQMDEIFAACTNTNIQKSLFSATIPSGVETLAKTVMKDPIRIVIGAMNAATETIKQELLFVGSEDGKLVAIRQLVQKGLKPPVLIFVQSIDRAKELFHELVYDGINVDVIHSERTKSQRDNIIDQFRAGRIWVLISTELMARGLDFKGVNLVINYDFPQTVQSYIHRIGRTGRAGRVGEAITYFTKDDAPYLKSIVNVMRGSGCEVPEWMLTMKKPSQNMRKQLRKAPIERKQINTMSSYDKRKIAHKRNIIETSKRRKIEKETEKAA